MTDYLTPAIIHAAIKKVCPQMLKYQWGAKLIENLPAIADEINKKLHGQCSMCGCVVGDDIAYAYKESIYCRECLNALKRAEGSSADAAVPSMHFTGSGKRVIRSFRGLS